MSGTKPEGHSREDALSPEQLEQLLKLGPGEDPLDRVILVALVQLGLRADEAAHLSRSWLSIQERKLRVPAFSECHSGRDGHPCAKCARNLPAGKWAPKTAAGPRTIPYKDITGVADVLHAFFTANEYVGLSRVAIWRRVRAMADRAGLMKRAYPHALRATAATQFADLGFPAQDLCDVMGWDDIRVARPYLKRSGRNVEEAIRKGKAEGRAWI
jgi:site-specific recombinase XerD